MSLSLASVMARCKPFGNCLLWQGPMACGSPQVSNGSGKYIQARRFVYEQNAGAPIRAGLSPVMKCRNPRCLVYWHMELMTPKQIGARAADDGKFSSVKRRAAIASGRRREQNRKINIEIARAIRASDEPGPVLAARYGIHRTLVSRIRRGEAWCEWETPAPQQPAPINRVPGCITRSRFEPPPWFKGEFVREWENLRAQNETSLNQAA